MACKPTTPKSKKKITLLFLLIMTAAGGFYYMEREKYQMYVFHTTAYGEAEWPNKKIWFDAKKWIGYDGFFIKSTDRYLIKKSGIPIPDKKLFIESLYDNLIRKEIIKENQTSYKEFIQQVSPYIKGYYLYTEFDRDTYLPTIHNFLIVFFLQKKYYEVNLEYDERRKYYFVYGIYEYGEYKKMNKNYNYQEYRRGLQPPEY